VTSWRGTADARPPAGRRLRALAAGTAHHQRLPGERAAWAMPPHPRGQALTRVVLLLPVLHAAPGLPHVEVLGVGLGGAAEEAARVLHLPLFLLHDRPGL
jgi:hypothetical protein